MNKSDIPFDRPRQYDRKTKAHISRREEIVVRWRKYRKQKPGRVQPGVKWTIGYRQPQDVTVPAFSRLK